MWRSSRFTLLAGVVAAGCRTAAPAHTAAAPPPALIPTAPLPAPPAPPRPVLLSPADVDRMVASMWDASGAEPAAPAGDAEFLRRVTLDTIGRIPTMPEAERFLADQGPDKRARLVDALLASQEHAEHAADVAMDLFVGRQFRKPKLEKRLDPRAFFVAAFRENRPYDRLTREMLTFSGEILPSGPGVYLASHLRGGGGPEAAASATARLFLGVQIQCAQCHDHPYDPRYKQEDFYGLVAYFSRTRAREEKIDGAAPMSGADGKRFFIVDRSGGKRIQAKFKPPGMAMGAAGEERTATARFFGRQIETLRNETPRETLARAVTESDLFAKAAVDRTWAELFGRGIIEPWDDLGGEGDPDHPPLLVRLADDFRASGHDLRHLQRILLLSRAYGLTSHTQAPSNHAAAPAGSAGPPPPFARAVVRRLSPEQLFQSLLMATGADHAGRGEADEIQKKVDRALREYLFVFGDDEMAEVDTFNGNIPQALLLWNGEITNQGARARPGSTLAAILAATTDPAERLRRLFLTAYARPPTESEVAQLVPAPAAGQAAWEDLFFALLTSTEMLTNH